jgi:GntR family transcriptional regulator
LIVLTRVLRMNGKPVIYDEIRLSPTVFKGLTAAKINEFQGTIYSLYETFYGIRIVQAEERLKAIPAPARVAEHLGLKAGAPILSIERVALTYGDKPVEWRVSLCNTENHYYLNEIG